MKTALLLMVGVGLGAQIAGLAVFMNEAQVMSGSRIVLTFVAGGALGGLVSVVLWDLTRRHES